MSDKEKPEIHGKLIAIMREVDPIKKGQKNKFHGYNFRGIDDVYNALHDIHAKHGVRIKSEIVDYSREERATAKGGLSLTTLVKVRWHFVAEDGSSDWTEALGEAADSHDKSAAKAQAYSLKASLLSAYLISTEETKDMNIENNDQQVRPGNMTKIDVGIVDPFEIEQKYLNAGVKDKAGLAKFYNSLSPMEQKNASVREMLKKYQEEFNGN